MITRDAMADAATAVLAVTTGAALIVGTVVEVILEMSIRGEFYVGFRPAWRCP